LTPRRTLFVVLAAVVSLSVVASGSLAAAAGRSASARAAESLTGRELYRKFCGQCHAFKAARAVGFGSNKSGLGKLGGPSFDELRIPYTISVRHVTQPTGGHEIVRTRITLKQLHTVAAYIAEKTRRNPIPALPTDG